MLKATFSILSSKKKEKRSRLTLKFYRTAIIKKWSLHLNKRRGTHLNKRWRYSNKYTAGEIEAPPFLLSLGPIRACGRKRGGACVYAYMPKLRIICLWAVRPKRGGEQDSREGVDIMRQRRHVLPRICSWRCRRGGCRLCRWRV